jgi:hypothetical protein
MDNEAHEQIHELRQYTLHPGRRDDLVEVFDRWFIEGMEDLGMVVQGQFSDLDRPDHFVWLRSFPDLEARRVALEGFYSGPVWAAHRDAANATMTAWDDVLLLHQVSASDAGFAADRPLPPIGSTEVPDAMFAIDVNHYAGSLDEKALDFYLTRVEPALAEAGGERLALLLTHPGPNTYTELPIRENEQVIVRVTRFDDVQAGATHREWLGRSENWARIQAEWAPWLAGPSQHLRLRPTPRSRLR